MDMITQSNVFIAPVMQLMKLVIDDEESRDILQTDWSPMYNLLLDIASCCKLIGDQRKEALEALNVWMQLLQNSFTEARSLLHRSKQQRQRRHRQRCLDLLICNPRPLSQEIKEWKVLFDYLFQALQTDFLIFVSARHIVKSSPILEDVAKSAQSQVETWLTEAYRVRIIAVYGMPGVGKTSLLKRVYKAVRREVFQHVIWVTVPLNYTIMDLQRQIAKAIHTSLESDISFNKQWLSKKLKGKKFVLVLDDLRSPLDLQEVIGVAFRKEKQSKVLFSTRNRDLIPLMSAEESIEVQPLSTDEAWMLFRRIAFKDSRVSMDIEGYARNMADECKGLPLAISLVAAAMTGKTRVDEWKTCLSSINAAPSFADTDPQLLYQRSTRFSYDALPDSNVQNCFLYCAMFPENEEIYVENLVQMWIAEGLVRSKQGSHLMDMAIGLSYINLLVDRCLFKNVQIKDSILPCVWKGQSVRVEHVIRDMAIYNGEKEENGLFRADQHLQNFPENFHNEYCERISVSNNDIENLPTEFTCPKLVSLFLSENSQIEELPSGFLVSLTSLKVLNLSGNRRINSIPSSVGQLKQLEDLQLRDMKIEELPDEICNLSSLQFLDLQECDSLTSLPSKIGELQNLKYLNLWACVSLSMIPHQISQLTSLSTLYGVYSMGCTYFSDSEATIWSLKGLRSLTKLMLDVKVEVQEGITSSGIKVGIMGTWLEMRHLFLEFEGGEYVMDDLPHDIQSMSKLQSFHMGNYHGLSLPEYSCKFQHLEYLELHDCPHLTELSPLERLPNLKTLKLIEWPKLKQLGIGNSDSARGFMMLEKLVLAGLPELESIAGALNNGVWNERTLPRFRILKINRCPSLKRLPMGMNMLLNLSQIFGEEEWRQTIIWQDDTMKTYFGNLFTDWKPGTTEYISDDEQEDKEVLKLL